MGCCSVSPEMTRKSLFTPIDKEIVAIGVATIYTPVAQLERVLKTNYFGRSSKMKFFIFLNIIENKGVIL